MENTTKTTSVIVPNNQELEVVHPTEIQYGKPVLLVIREINKDTVPTNVYVVDGITELDIKLFVKSSLGGSSVPTTPLGKNKVQVLLSGLQNYGAVILKPGESYEWKVDLSKYYVLDPGSYSISIFSTELVRFDFVVK